MSQRGEGWAVGDLALCVDDGPVRRTGNVIETDKTWNILLKKGYLYTVTHIIFAKDTGEIGLFDFDAHIGGCATRFIKVTPPEADAFDHEVIEQMAGLPVGVE